MDLFGVISEGEASFRSVSFFTIEPESCTFAANQNLLKAQKLYSTLFKIISWK